MPRAQGARSQMAFAYETTYGVPPASGYRQVPFASTSLGGEQPLLESELLGFGRDPLAPILDAFNADGDVMVPIDVNNIGFWLKGTFGQPESLNAFAASGAINFSAQPAVNSTITLNGTTFTFVASGATALQSNIGANLAATMTALAIVLNANATIGLTFATYAGIAAGLTITRGVLGVAGNSFTLAASVAPVSNGTVSGPTLTGGALTHTFASGSFVLPSIAIETQMPEVPRFAMLSGCMVDELSWEMQRSGLLAATVKLIAQNEVIAPASVAGTLTALALQRFGHFNGSITRNSVALANVTTARITYRNSLERIDAIRQDGRIEGLDPSMAAMSGSLTARFADLTLFNQAIAAAPCALVFAYALPANATLTLTIHEVYLPRPRVSIEGPGGIQATFDWQAARAVLTPFRMCTAVLTNTIASY